MSVDLSTKDFVLNAALPPATATYTVISHKFVMDTVEDQLQLAGFEIEREMYKATTNGNVATGILRLKEGSDQEMRMMFAWSNSYDKTMRFKCAIGGYLPQSGSILVSGNMGNWGRRHTGTADQETFATIQHQISQAGTYYAQLIADKDAMKNIIVDERRRAEVLGILYFEHGLLGIQQTSIIKSELKRPSFNYTGDKDSLWALYCHIIYSLQKCHPKNWLDQQRLIHFFMCDIFDVNNAIIAPAQITALVQDPLQLDLEDAIKDAERQAGSDYDVDKHQIQHNHGS